MISNIEEDGVEYVWRLAYRKSENEGLLNESKYTYSGVKNRAEIKKNQTCISKIRSCNAISQKNQTHLREIKSKWVTWLNLNNAIFISSICN